MMPQLAKGRVPTRHSLATIDEGLWFTVNVGSVRCSGHEGPGQGRAGWRRSADFQIRWSPALRSQSLLVGSCYV